MKRLAGASVSALILAMLSTGPLKAATEAPKAEAGTDVGEVIVTATRREETVSKISQSITALNGKALQIRGVKSVDDVVRLTPGIELNANGFGTQAELSIRGISSPLVGAATTGIYIDDTPIQARNVGYSATNTYPLVFDLDRVEVLRGPQGTLFGAGAEGGAVRFITPAPSLTRYSAYVRSEVASTEHGDPSYEFGVAVGGPIITDKIGFRASAWTRHDGGYVDRIDQNPEITNPTVFKNTNWADTEVFSLALTMAPTEHLKISPSVFFQDRWLNDIGTYWEDASNPAAGRFVNGQPLAQPDHDEFVLPALAIRYDFGSVSVISNTSFFQRKDSLIDDYSTLIPAIFALTNFIPGSPDYASYAEMVNKQTVYTEELRVQSSDPQSRLAWVTGLFLSESDQKSYETIVDPKFGDVTEYAYGLSVPDALGLPLINGVYSLWANGYGQDRQVAGYGEASYRLLEQLKLTAGVRVARTSFTGSSFGTGPFVGATIVQPRETTSETPVTPKFGASWQIDDNNLLYATVAKGYRIGGANAPLSDFCAIGLQGYTSVPTTYQSDSVWSYEIGAKDKLFDRKLEIDASAFHIDWSNIQQLVYVSNCGQQFVDNLGQAASNGFDVQMAARPAPGLTIELSVGYTDATFSHAVNKNPGVAANIVSAGDHIENHPWSFVLGVTYQRRILNDHEGYIRLDYEHHSQSAVTPVTDPANGAYDPSALPAPATDFMTLRAGTRWRGYDVSLFVDNLLDATPALTRYSEVLGNPVHRDFTFRPRTIGLTASYRY